MKVNKYSLEFPEKWNNLIKNLVYDYQKMYVKAELVDKNGCKKVRVNFEGTTEMKDDFIRELNNQIRHNK